MSAGVGTLRKGSVDTHADGTVTKWLERKNGQINYNLSVSASISDIVRTLAVLI